MSALGQKQTYAAHKLMSALPPIATTKADSANDHVCFTPESGLMQCNSQCLLRAINVRFADDSLLVSKGRDATRNEPSRSINSRVVS